MKTYLTIIILILGLSAQAQIKTIVPGDTAPDISLQNVDGKTISFNSYPGAKGFVVVFTCNTCPVAKAYEQRIIELDSKLNPQGYQVIAVNPNDPSLSPGDNLQKMQERAKAMKYGFPYLFDPGQIVTNAYGATRTPQLFVVARSPEGLVVRYTGAIDDDQGEENADRNRFVEAAVASLLKNEQPVIASTKAIGCTVKRP